MKTIATIANMSCLLLAILLINGCATNSKILVRSDGKAVRCWATGMGAIGAAASSMTFDKCVENYTSLGFVDIDEAGVTGVRRIGKQNDKLIVLMVAPSSPASNAGVVAGDQILEIGNTPVIDPVDAISRLFGNIGTQIEVKIRKVEGAEQVISLTRVPFKSIAMVH